MIIQCKNCSTKFRFDESKISGESIKLKCSKCKSVFAVHKPKPDKPLPKAAKPAPVQAAAPAAGPTCPYCNKGVDEGTHFCPHCGEDVTRKKAAPAGANPCPSCHRPNPPECKFCVDCGTPMKPAQRVQVSDQSGIKCPQCAAPNPADSKFCAECGTKFAKSEASDQPTVTDQMKQMYAEQGLDNSSDEAGGTLFPFTAGWGDDYSGDTVNREGEDTKLVLTLKVIAGPDEGQEYKITKKRTIIGRADADIIIDDFKISRNHAEIEILGPKFLLKDLESTNGTFLNDQMTPADFLSNEDSVKIGDTTYMVIIEEERFV